jgi:2-amino-4-hydroxy-6-hydroxymethyldihydropteridine diphosphokinase
MPFILSTGSNLGDRLGNLILAKDILSSFFKIVSESSIYQSKAVNYLKQAHFYNQALQFSSNSLKPEEVLTTILEIELFIGRERKINKGPRIIDIDIIFWDCDLVLKNNLIIPHPRWRERSFIVIPILELPYSKKLLQHFSFPKKLKNQCKKI